VGGEVSEDGTIGVAPKDDADEVLRNCPAGGTDVGGIVYELCVACCGAVISPIGAPKGFDIFELVTKMCSLHQNILSNNCDNGIYYYLILNFSSLLQAST